MNFKVERRFRDYLAAEVGSHRFREGGAFRVCLVYPNSYHVGMSNLGLQINLSILSEIPGLTVERAFLPDPDLMDAFGPGRSPLVSLETRRPLSQFDVLAFSVTYEMDYLNLVRILRLADLEPLKERREPGDPLVVAGGAAITANPFAMEDLVDIAWIGESEVWLRRFGEALMEGWDTPNLLDSLAQMPHVFVPGRSDYRSVYTSIRQFELEEHPAVSRIMTPHTAFASTGLMEITRGCKWPCRFCIARTLYGTVRMLELGKIRQLASQMKPHTRKLGLFGAGISDHPQLTEILSTLGQDGFTVNTSSLRFTAMTPELVEALVTAGQRTLTVAPESFSGRILKRLAKGLNEPMLHKGLENIVASDIRTVKVYHIIGVEGEEPEDLDQTVAFLGPYSKRSNNILWELGYSILEPKPHTPFEDHDLAPKSDVEASIRHLRRTLHAIGRVKISYPSYSETMVADWLCRGDARVGRHLVEVLHEDPHRRFRLPRKRYRQDIADIRASGWPWALLPPEPKAKDGKQVIPHSLPRPQWARRSPRVPSASSQR